MANEKFEPAFHRAARAAPVIDACQGQYGLHYPFPQLSGSSFTFLETQGAYELAWDLDKDGRFDDFKFKVALSDDAKPLGAGLQGDQESELVFSGMVGSSASKTEAMR